MGWEDDRGVSEVLGAILVFALLVLLLGSYQAFVVPSANEDVEFEHNQEVQGDIQELRRAIRAAETTDASQSTTVAVGARYPTRVLALNPSQPTGSLDVVNDPDQTITIENLRATNEDAGTWWDGDDRQFPSGHLVYQPRYNYFSGPDTYVDNSVVFNEFGNGEQLSITDQRLVQGNKITIGSLAGDQSYTRTKSSVDLNPISAGSTTVQVESDDGDDIEITIPTQLSEDKWEELLEDEGNVEDVFSNGDGFVTIQLDGDETYDLQMGRVGVGSTGESERAHYLYRAQGDGQFVQQNQQTSVTVQVRDRYNNPVSNTDVEFTAGEIEDRTIRTDEDGYAKLPFRTPSENTTMKITAEADVTEEPTATEGDRKSVEFEVNVGAFSSPGIGADLNPGQGLLFEDATADTEGNQYDEFTLTLNNTFEEDVTIAQLRVNAIVLQEPGTSSDGRPVRTMTMETEEFDVRGPYEDASFDTIGEGDTPEYEISFQYIDNGNVEDVEMQEGDYFIMSVILDNGDSSTYIISPRIE